MDTQEADELLTAETGRFRQLSYKKLTALVGQPQVMELRGQSGKSYQLEVDCLWDSAASDNVRVILSIDDGRLRSSICPMSQDFIMGPDGSFVGE